MTDLITSDLHIRAEATAALNRIVADRLDPFRHTDAVGRERDENTIRIALTTPLTTELPLIHPHTSLTAQVEQLRDIAETLDNTGIPYAGGHTFTEAADAIDALTALVATQAATIAALKEQQLTPNEAEDILRSLEIADIFDDTGNIPQKLNKITDQRR
jgi:hypothetical protein